MHTTLAGALKVLLYEGQSSSRQQGEVTPAQLAAADVVITTYNTLAKDIYHQPDVNGEVVHNLRHKRKYEVHIPSRPALLLPACMPAMSPLSRARAQ